MNQTKIEQQKKLLKRIQGQVLTLLDEAETPTQENLIMNIDENLSRINWRYEQLVRTLVKEDK